MDPLSSSLAEAIGERVKRRRQARRWTLDTLAEAAGVSRRALVNVENGTANPSVGTLLRIGEALGVGLPTLVEPPGHQSVTVTRQGEGAVLWTGESGGRGVMVAGTGSPDVVELWDWSLAAGESHASEAHPSGTRELLQIRTGQVEITVGDEVFLLEPGDAVGFPGDLAHGYRNASTQPASFTLAVFEPGVGSQ